MDLRATPVGAAYPGVEIHANLIAGMLDGAIKHKPPYILGADVLLVLIAGRRDGFPAADAVTVPRDGGRCHRVAAAAEYEFQLLARIQRCASTRQAVIAVVLLYAMNMSWGYFVESRTKRQLTGLFGQYVPPELVEEMSRDPENYSMAGRKAELQCCSRTCAASPPFPRGLNRTNWPA
jgi:adenylate cyclase